MEDKTGVLVYGELAGTKLAGTTCELLECGRRLAADLGQRLACVLVGEVSDTAAAEAAARGAATVYVASIPQECAFDGDVHVAAAAAAVATAEPGIVLLGHTPLGREIGPRLAFRLGAAVSTDCIDLRIDPDSGKLIMTKPVYGGNALLDSVAQTAPQLATVRAKAMPTGEPTAENTPNVVHLSFEMPTTRLTITDRVQEEVEGVKLEDAPIVVSGGRGVGGPEPFTTILQDLAAVLHGAVGASRPACDNGWAPEAMHIGLTGKIVAPDIYIAVAISGASQHMSGCAGSKTIIAINKDAEANIFREAAYGVVGRYEDVVPAFTARLRELLAD